MVTANREENKKAPSRAVPIGTVVVSKSGRDRGRVYLVIDSDESFLFLADGDKRPFARPKKKRHRHVSAVGQIESGGVLIDRIQSIKVGADQSALIRRELTVFAASHANP